MKVNNLGFKSHKLDLNEYIPIFGLLYLFSPFVGAINEFVFFLYSMVHPVKTARHKDIQETRETTKRFLFFSFTLENDDSKQILTKSPFQGKLLWISC